MKTKSQSQRFKPEQRDQGMPEQVHDAYKLPGKLSEPSVCPDCGAVYHVGRWQWLPCPDGAEKIRCPACHRIRDDIPAGYVILEGEFLAAHRDELIKLLQHHETRERTEHPMQRIMKIDEKPGRITVTTTDVHLARDFGEALHHAYQGALDLQYNKDENLVRVHWRR